ncbi:hypothetical protein N7505_003201 [Penicillium chrysogenum]|uniref:Uncharacterized protein n=1 Tax=Penicillium chrysogenum TaxID=5076 RepID=A0ABQ8WQB0_PENCH|nr:hypothetical protein N7505_003201 [Penicillium chrysogenum]
MDWETYGSDLYLSKTPSEEPPSRHGVPAIAGISNNFVTSWTLSSCRLVLLIYYRTSEHSKVISVGKPADIIWRI